MPMGSFKIEKVTSLDAFKSKLQTLGPIRPAVLVNGVLHSQEMRRTQ